MIMPAIKTHANQPPKPVAPEVHVDSIPDELKALKRWVGWRHEYRDDKAKWDKVPVSCHSGRRADITDPVTWSSFDEVVAYVNGRNADGIGFVFDETDPYAGVDVDHCRDSESGRLTKWAAAVVRKLNSYTEISPSGTGLHVIVRGKLAPGGGNRKANVEFYDRAKFFCVTGLHLDGTPETVVDREDELARLHDYVFSTNDKAIIERASQVERFRLLWEGDWSAYPSESEADLALCGMLAYWTLGDGRMVERLFGMSKLGRRAKWQARPDYRENTIRKAIAGQLSEVFTRGTRIRQENTEKTEKPRHKHTADSADDKVEVVAPPSGGEEGGALSVKAEYRQGEALELAVELAAKEGAAPDWVASFKLARRLRTLSVDEPEQFEMAVEAFCEAAGRDFEPLWYAFLDCWGKVRHAEGEGELVWAAEQAEKYPYPLANYPGRKCDQYKKLASIAYHLSCLTAPRPFWLTRERVAPLLGCKHPMEVTRIINLLEDKGVIKCVDHSYRFAGPAPKAKEYIFTERPLDGLLAPSDDRPALSSAG
jgi:putative DNA primase/helicase